MRDLIVAAFVLGSLPTCFRRPFIGLLLFTLLAYMRLQDLTWGFARFERWSFYVAVVTFAGFLAFRGERRFMLPDVRCWMMIGLVALVGASILASRFLVPRDFANYVEYIKIIAIALFTTGVVRNREYLRILVWVIALSFGFYGVKNGLAFLLSGGSLQIIQGPGGMLSDNNDFALALCMGLPMLLHLALSERRTLIRRTVLATIPLTVMTIVATHSRGAFVALVATLLLLVWRSRNRVAGFALVALCAVGGWLVAPESYKTRIASISEYETEGSAKGRIEAWKVAGRMIAARPLLGVGYAKFQQEYVAYDPNRSTDVEGDAAAAGTRVAHNSYLQIWAECGTPAFLLYLLLIALSFRDLGRVRREAETRYHASWIISYASMFEASLLAFVVGATFLNRAQFDLFYHFVAIILVFGYVARAALLDERAHPLRGGERGPLTLQRERGFGSGAARGGFERRAPRPGFGQRPALGTS